MLLIVKFQLVFKFNSNIIYSKVEVMNFIKRSFNFKLFHLIVKSFILNCPPLLYSLYKFTFHNRQEFLKSALIFIQELRLQPLTFGLVHVNELIKVFKLVFINIKFKRMKVGQPIRQVCLFFEDWDVGELAINFILEHIRNFKYQVQIISYFDVKFMFIQVNYLN